MSLLGGTAEVRKENDPLRSDVSVGGLRLEVIQCDLLML
jgi:hypothetical protein